MRVAIPALIIGVSVGDASSAFISARSSSLAQRYTGEAHQKKAPLAADAAAAASADNSSQEIEQEKEKKTKPASPAELLARARRNAGLADDEDEPPKLFEDDLLDDFQSCLLTLEKRVKGGPGSLTAEEVTKFEAETGRILEDMKRKLGTAEEPMPSAVTTLQQPTHPPPPPPPPPPAPTSARPVVEEAEMLAAASYPSSSGVEKSMDTSNDEGPAYTGTGGLGLATGTRNTWIIPGMDEMSAEEYQQALQRSVIERQERRRRANRGVLGNRAAHSYLDTLGWGGASSNLAADEDEGKEREYESRPELYDA